MWYISEHLPVDKVFVRIVPVKSMGVIPRGTVLLGKSPISDREFRVRTESSIIIEIEYGDSLLKIAVL